MGWYILGLLNNYVYGETLVFERMTLCMVKMLVFSMSVY